MNREEKIQYIIKNILPDLGDNGRRLYGLVRQFSDHELNTAIEIHSLDAAGVLTEQDIKPLRYIFNKYDRELDIEISHISEIHGN